MATTSWFTTYIPWYIYQQRQWIFVLAAHSLLRTLWERLRLKQLERSHLFKRPNVWLNLSKPQHQTMLSFLRKGSVAWLLKRVNRLMSQAPQCYCARFLRNLMHFLKTLVIHEWLTGLKCSQDNPQLTAAFMPRRNYCNFDMTIRHDTPLDSQLLHTMPKHSD